MCDMSPVISFNDNSRHHRLGNYQNVLDVMQSKSAPLDFYEDGPVDTVRKDDREALLQEPHIQPVEPPQDYRAEFGNIMLLLFLYMLQGIPLGLAGSIPLILQSKNISYKDQAFFSFVFWPFSLKLLWAPLVDAVYFKSFGCRKSWLVSTQYIIGLFMMYLSVQVEPLLGEVDGQGPDVMSLTMTFFLFEFLATTQDIAVDG